uniref:Uncharacterized protein n=1 Tax=Arundo donax TaxID=35708 RepID=A0A0A9G0Z0_ARUDO
MGFDDADAGGEEV